MNRALHYIFSIILICISFSEVQAEQPEDLSIKIYPTEVRDGYFYIEFNAIQQPEAFRINVSNLLGSEVQITYQAKVHGLYRVSFQDMPSSGIYIVRVTQGSKQTMQRILVRSN